MASISSFPHGDCNLLAARLEKVGVPWKVLAAVKAKLDICSTRPTKRKEVKLKKIHRETNRQT